MSSNIFQFLRSFLGVFLSTVIAMFSTSISFGNDRITVEPCVFESGSDCCCIMWETSKKGSGYVKYTYNGEEKTAFDSAGGVVRSEDTLHRVYVPKEELRDNDYRVGSKYVGFKYAYEAITGETVESGTYHFNGAPGDDGIHILCVADTYGQKLLFRQAVKRLKEKPDLIVLLGDVCYRMETKADFCEQLLGTASALSAGEIPVVFVRGDRETKGEFASQLSKYLPSATDGLYDSFDFGALSAVVLDTGEDEAGIDIINGNLVDFDTYLAREDQWIRSLNEGDFSGRYKLVFRHLPEGDSFSAYPWNAHFAALGFDAVIGGHSFTAGRNDDAGIPAYSVGGRLAADVRLTTVTLKDGTISVCVANGVGIPLFADEINVPG